MSAKKPPGYMTEDLQPRITGGPRRYTTRTRGPVEYIALEMLDGTPIGCYYANDADEAVGFVVHPRATIDAQNALGPWVRALGACKSQGLLPTAALDSLIAQKVDSATNPRSHVVSAARLHADSVEALTKLLT